MPAVRAEAHFVGNFAFLGSAAELRGQCIGYGIHLLLPFAQIARSPIELTQAIQNGALDTMFGISVEDHILVRVVLGDGIEQPQDTGVGEIVQIHMHGQVLVYTNRDSFHQWQVFEDNPVAHFLRDFRFPLYRQILGSHRFSSFFLFFFRNSGCFPDDLRECSLSAKQKKI